MITLLVDESFAFDFLSILEVKYRYSKTKNDTLLKQITDCYNHLKEQLGNDLMEKIYNSEEYRQLVCVNAKTFEWVDKAKTDSCKASDVDRSNFDRCVARKALQRKFFDNETTEVKIGYEVYK